MDQITLTRPDDWHIHLRDGPYLRQTVADASRIFGRVLAMPNLDPPIINSLLANQYREKIMPFARSGFHPLFALYLTEKTTKQDIENTKTNSDFIPAYKLYPAGATTNSKFGVHSIEKMYPIFESIEENNLVLCIHGEVTDSNIDVFDREKHFIDGVLSRIIEEFPSLRIVLEHITTEDAVEFVKSTTRNVAATITVHHLLYNRNAMLEGGLNPLFYCLPVLKRDTHQRALIDAATSGNPKFFLGTDSAPHPRHEKEKICGCAAGCYTAHAAMELYAEVFDEFEAITMLEGFASHFGADFYRFPRNKETITLEKINWTMKKEIMFGHDQLVPIKAGETLKWRIKSTQ